MRANCEEATLKPTDRIYDPELNARRKGWMCLRKRKVDGDGVQAPGYVTLCNTGNLPQPFVVHFFNAQDGGFHGGEYHEKVLDAMGTFNAQAERYTRHMRPQVQKGEL
jgi:hypothetical protein